MEKGEGYVTKDTKGNMVKQKNAEDMEKLPVLFKDSDFFPTGACFSLCMSCKFSPPYFCVHCILRHNIIAKGRRDQAKATTPQAA